MPDLALWRRLRAGAATADMSVVELPRGDGPVLILHGGGPAAAPVAAALRAQGQGVRLTTLGAAAAGILPGLPVLLPQAPVDLPSARALIGAVRPAVLVLFDADLPGPLIAAADEAGVPITLVDARLPVPSRAWWGAGTARATTARITRLLVPDRAARTEAVRRGVVPARIEITGPFVPTPDPLPVNAREHAALLPLLRNRHVWLAASLPVAEAAAVIAAHRGVLSYNHRAVLIVAPADGAAAEPIAALAEAQDLTVARRVDDEEPVADIQMLVAEDSAELGLWYRLAPVCFAGGTLIPPEVDRTRHPFEAAGLGSALVHGPALGVHEEAWRRLDRAGAVRAVVDAAGLARAAADLTAPDLAARLAQAAWDTVTAGAAVAQRIAGAILSDIPQDEA